MRERFLRLSQEEKGEGTPTLFCRKEETEESCERAKRDLVGHQSTTTPTYGRREGGSPVSIKTSFFAKEKKKSKGVGSRGKCKSISGGGGRKANTLQFLGKPMKKAVSTWRRENL